MAHAPRSPHRNRKPATTTSATQIASEQLVQRVTHVLARYREPITVGLRMAVDGARALSSGEAAPQGLLEAFYGQMAYHLGWRQADLRETDSNPGKLIRPTLVLLGCEFAGAAIGHGPAQRAADVDRAMPAAVAIELVHNFSLIHDDIEDRDEERRHRPTLWRVWGQPQAVNTGDGMFALARLTLLTLIENGVSPALVAQLSTLLDRTCLRLCEGQHLDMSFEGRRDITTEMYLAMIERKTAELMACALEVGARLAGADDELAMRLSAFGRALGMAFQLRDDALGIWANFAQLGKAEAGDLRRKKMSLPVIYALEHASAVDRRTLDALYASAAAATDDEIALALTILERVDAPRHVREALRQQTELARSALAAAAGSSRAVRQPFECLSVLVDFVAHEI